jgi:hypothetical protein
MLTTAEWEVEYEGMFDEWKALVERFGDDTAVIIAGDWTFRDVTAHLNGWREWTARRMEAAANDFETPLPPWPGGMSEETAEGTDEINAWFVGTREPKEMPALIEEAERQFARILAALAALPDEALAVTPSWLDGYPISAVLEGCIEHWEEHRAEPEAWLEAHNR